MWNHCDSAITTENSCGVSEFQQGELKLKKDFFFKFKRRVRNAFAIIPFSPQKCSIIKCNSITESGFLSAYLLCFLTSDGFEILPKFFWMCQVILPMADVNSKTMMSNSWHHKQRRKKSYYVKYPSWNICESFVKLISKLRISF